MTEIEEFVAALEDLIEAKILANVDTTYYGDVYEVRKALVELLMEHSNK